ncbi:MAG: hypothetical protein V3T17_12910 [Pseudomonadales bacterium]
MINIDKLRLQLPESLADRGFQIGQWVDRYLTTYLGQTGLYEDQNLEQLTLDPMEIDDDETEQQIGEQIAMQLAEKLKFETRNRVLNEMSL